MGASFGRIAENLGRLVEQEQDPRKRLFDGVFQQKVLKLFSNSLGSQGRKGGGFRQSSPFRRQGGNLGGPFAVLSGGPNPFGGLFALGSDVLGEGKRDQMV